MKTRSGVAIAYSEFADARLSLTVLVNTAFSILLGDYIFIYSHRHMNSPALKALIVSDMSKGVSMGEMDDAGDWAEWKVE